MTSKTDSSDGYDNELQATASRYFAPFGQFRLTHCIVLVDFQFPLSIISCLFCCISFGIMDVHCRYLQHSFTNISSTFFLLIFICCFFFFYEHIFPIHHFTAYRLSDLHLPVHCIEWAHTSPPENNSD